MGKLLARTAIPGSVALLVSSAYNLVDTILVGQGVGPLAIGAVSLVFPVRVIVMSFGNLVESIILVRGPKPKQVHFLVGSVRGT
jgi:Na+-driven multidrug efflux pump